MIVESVNDLLELLSLELQQMLESYLFAAYSDRSWQIHNCALAGKSKVSSVGYEE